METYKGHDIARKDGDKWYWHYSPKPGALEGGFTGKAMSVRECRKCIDIHFKKGKVKTLNIKDGFGAADKDPRDRKRKRKVDTNA